MEWLFIVGTVLLILSVIAHILLVIFAINRLKSAKSEDYLQKYYNEEFGEEP